MAPYYGICAAIREIGWEGLDRGGISGRHEIFQACAGSTGATRAHLRPTANLPRTLHAGVPGSTAPVNLDASGLALRGYDPVAYFETGRPTQGKATITASFDGARYRFASDEHRKAFMKDPTKYLPQFGGFCTVGAAFGEKVDTDPETGKVINGKLYLNNGPKAQAIFDKDPSDAISRAGKNWPAVKDKPL